ncbi:MAG: hypothetical protein HOC71_14200, partial [Candidatus Latescibacteria bacterium]|nr:hypothetical protein [Candidatus Latescibacterota bacterium]
MSKTNRREFLRKAAVGSASVVASLAAAGLFPRRVPAKEFKRVFYRQFGSTGFGASEMGFGAMNMRDPALVHAAIDSGINYIDTAHSYMNGVNEQIVGQVMKDRRKEVFLTTKIKFYKQNIDIKDMPDMLTTSLKRLQTDHVDLVLLHVCDKREEVLDDRLMKIFDDYRKKGQTRFIGVSTHENQAEMLDAAVESKFWEAVLTGYNYFSPPELTAAIQRAREAGLAITAMKTLITTGRPRKPFPD